MQINELHTQSNDLAFYPDTEYVDITVQNGRIISANPDRNCANCEPLALESFQQYTVDGIFNRALGMYHLVFY